MTLEEIRAKRDALTREITNVAGIIETRNLTLRKLEEQRNAFYNMGHNDSKDNTMANTIITEFMNGTETRSAHSEMKLNGTGREFYTAVVEKARINKPIFSRCGQIRGAFAGMNIPLIKSRPAVNAESAEATYDNSVDSQMSVGKKVLNPSVYYATVAQSYQLKNWSVITDAEIEDAIAEAFGEAIELGAQSRNAGSSYPISGLLSTDTSVVANANLITAGSASTCSWADVLALVAKVKGKLGKYSIVCPTELVNALLLDTTQGYSELRNELANKGTIRGIEVVEIGTALSHTANAVYACAIDLQKNYKVAITADDMLIREVTEKGFLGSYLQAATGIASGVALPSDVFSLVAHS